MRVPCLLLSAALAVSVQQAGACDRFGNSTYLNDPDPAEWRLDFGVATAAADPPWLAFDFRTQPEEYMEAVKSTAQGHFEIDAQRLAGTGQEPWWISPWMDYSTAGREPLMGLTKERGPKPGDLAPVHDYGYQVWAVGFYNGAGAQTFAEIFADPCDPTFPETISFADGTASVKFLFTDATPYDITYLQGAPEYLARIDALGSSSSSRPVTDRTDRRVRLLQMDIAVKDGRATETGWVFGTFVWIGPTQGEGLFENLVPASLQWGNDPGVMDMQITESWINQDLDGVLFGWPERPTLGFNGRANGPADNIRSSCLSCHATARLPLSNNGILGFRFDMENDINDPAKVKAHIDLWFQNIPSGAVFDPLNPVAVSGLDYSLQLTEAVERMCLACKNGAMTGATPGICVSAGEFTQPNCAPAAPLAPAFSIESFVGQNPEALDAPRQ